MGFRHYIASDRTKTLYTDLTEAPNLYGDYTIRIHYYADHDSDSMFVQPITWHMAYRYLAYCPPPCTDAEDTGFWIEGSTDGRLLDDFVFSGSGGVLHVRNAPSPAATAAAALMSGQA